MVKQRYDKGKKPAAKKSELIRGKLELKKEGFGFVRAENGDIFIPPGNTLGAFDGEEVLCAVTGRSVKGREGRVEKVLSRLPYKVVGQYVASKLGDYVLSDALKGVHFVVRQGSECPQAQGKLVLFAVSLRGEGLKPPEGSVEEILGEAGAPGVDILSVAREYGLYSSFPDRVIEEVKAVSDYVDKGELFSREVLFGKKIFTIDGLDAKDLDDAVSIEKKKNGDYILGVHIADVSHYVKAGSALDKEAYRRGTSVYMVDEVIPMLPSELSNGICSLNEGVIRLTLSCFMEIDRSGKVVSHRMAKTAIRSVHRMNYAELNALFEGGEKGVLEKYADVERELYQMRELAALLRKLRSEKGSIDFDIRESKIEVDENRRAVHVYPREQGTAENLIEEFMILCNNTVAADFFRDGIYSIYRVHEKPDTSRMKELELFLTNFGYRRIGFKNVDIQKILEQSKGTPGENIIRTVVLRTMKKAVYSTNNIGHYGLASEAYTHFTSPIRRYPDLMVHRLVKERMGEAGQALQLDKVAERCSLTERQAIEAERAIENIKKAEYMEDKIGREYMGVVSGVTPTALFITLPNTVEGVVPVFEIQDDKYTFFKEMYCLIGSRMKKKISLGDMLKVQVKKVDVREARIEFSFKDMEKSR